MKIAEHSDVCAPFFDRLRHAPARALLLDYDGTLAPFTTDRTRAFPYREIPELVANVMRHKTRVVLVSGRAATELLFLSGIHPHPEIWGSHGAERLYPDGSYEVESPSDDQRTGLQIVTRSLRAAGLASRIETKPAGIAVHWRGLPAEERAWIENNLRTLSTSVVEDYGLMLLPFDGGLELRTSEKTKGDAVNTVLAECGKGVAIAYLGDDQTDENAFRAIKGRGLAILVRPEPRPTMADMWLRPPEELSQFLRDWIGACGADQ